MKGKVNARREAVLELQVAGNGKSRRMTRAVIDTGYTGALSLPPAVIQSLKMRLLGQRLSELANGRIVEFDVYQGQVIWDGKLKEVEIDESPCDPLVGMGLLDGFELNIQVKRNGSVSIRTLKGRHSTRHH